MSFGGAPAGNCYGTTDEDEMIKTIITAVKSGVNYIDTAPWYGQGKSEEVLGKVSYHSKKYFFLLLINLSFKFINIKNLLDTVTINLW